MAQYDRRGGGTTGGGHEAGGQHLFESLRRRPRLKNPITEDGQNAPGTVTNWQQVLDLLAEFLLWAQFWSSKICANPANEHPLGLLSLKICGGSFDITADTEGTESISLNL